MTIVNEDNAQERKLKAAAIEKLLRLLEGYFEEEAEEPEHQEAAKEGE